MIVTIWPWLPVVANWRPQVLVPMKTSSGEVWSAQIKLPDNVDDVFRYKFIVDGDWKYDSALPTLPNDALLLSKLDVWTANNEENRQKMHMIENP